MKRLPRLLTYLVERVKPRRFQVILVSFGLGLVAAALLYLGELESKHHRQAERHNAAAIRKNRTTIERLKRTDAKLAAAIRRVRSLEHPTRMQVRREIERLLRALTPAQGRRFGRLLGVSRPPSTVGGPIGRAPPAAPHPGPPSRPPFNPPSPPSPVLPPFNPPSPPSSPVLPGPLQQIVPVLCQFLSGAPLPALCTT